MKYNFQHVLNCEMCGDSTAAHKILGQRLNTSQGLKPKKKEGISVSIKKCSNCALIYSSPLAIPNDIQDHYGTPPEHYWTPAYFNWSTDYFEKQIVEAKELLSFTKGMKALDIGAGIGKAMLSMEHAGFDAYGFEPSIPFYERAISKMNISKEKLKLGMIENVDYDLETFDFITFGAVFEHLYHPASSLKKALSWLKPGGIIHIEVPSSQHFIAKLINLYYKFRGTNYVTHLSPMHAPFHLYEFSVKSFQAVAKDMDFKLEKKYFDVASIDFVPKFLQPLFSAYMSATDTGMQLTVYLRKS